MSEGTQEQSAAPPETGKWPRLWKTVAVVSATVAAIVAAVVGIISIVQYLSPGHKPAPPGKLLARAWVLNREEAAAAGRDSLPRQTLASTPTVEAILENNTDKPVRVLGEHVTIEAYAFLELCFSQGAGGEIPSAGNTVVRLPMLPLPGETRLEGHQHGEIAANGGGGRLTITFAASKLGYGIYRLRVQLHTQDPKQGVDLGSFVLSEPAALPRFGLYLPEDPRVITQVKHELSADATVPKSEIAKEEHMVAWCFRRNLANLNRVVDGPGQRSAELASLSAPVLTPNWERLLSAGSPRQGAFAAMEAHPLAAVYAAAATGDPRFERTVRRKVATHELHLLHAYPSDPVNPYDESFARIAANADPDQETYAALAEVRRRLAGKSEE
jgi:hypothetical protein